MSLFGNLNKPAGSGGLFGSSTTQPEASTGGLFGSTTAQPTGGGLFGSLNTPSSQPAATGSLFGGLNSNTNTSQPASTGGGMFGGLNAASQPSQTSGGGGLFGGVGLGGNAQAQQPPGGSVFGNPAPAQNQQPTSSLFGGGPASQPQSSLNATVEDEKPNPSYFNFILENSKKRANAESVQDDLPQLQLGLGDLRQRIKRLAPGAKDPSADGRAHYLLAASGVDPGAAVRDLSHFAAAASKIERPAYQEPQDTDVESYLANLQTQTTLSMIQDGLARSVRDFDNFLEDNVSMEWDAQRKRIYEHFGIHPKEVKEALGGGGSAGTASVGQGGFGRSRRSKAAGLASSRAPGTNGASTFGRSNLQKSVIGAAGPLGQDHKPLFADVEKSMEASGVKPSGSHGRSQREKQGNYASVVTELNTARLNNKPYAINTRFVDVLRETSDQHGPSLSNAYKALIEIVGENPDARSFAENNTAKERQYASAYVADNTNTSAGIDIKKRIIRGATRNFEKLKYEEMEDMIKKNMKDAQAGGAPDVVSRVKAYVRIMAIKKDLCGDNTGLQMVGESYVWPLIYFLLRTGHVKEASAYVAAEREAFRIIDRNFHTYIQAYSNSPDHRLQGENLARINNEYNQRLRIAPENSIDPYRMACYKIIGRCDLKSRSIEGFAQGVDDFAWLQFVLAREIPRADAMANEVYGLDEVQETFKALGNQFFLNKNPAEIGSNFGIWVFLQVASGLFEDAVSYLYTNSYVDGVHLAIALDFYGLLRVSDPLATGDNLLSQTTRNQPQINFGRMVGLYTRDFRAANVSAAVDYLTLICLNHDLPGQQGRTQMGLCHEALRELVLESREFAHLLGDIQANGERIPGYIGERVKLIGLEESQEFMRTITMQAASVADDNGRTTDAVLLYHLAGEYDSVIVTVNRALSEAAAVPLGNEAMKIEPLKPRADAAHIKSSNSRHGAQTSLTSVDDPVVLAQTMQAIYAEHQYNSRIKLINIQACNTLLGMIEAKGLVESGQWTLALDAMKNLDILPLSVGGNAVKIRSLASKFSSLPQPVATNIPNLLMWAIVCCNRIKEAMANSRYGGNEGTRLMVIEEMKQNNMDMVQYCGQLRYRFPPAIHEALARAQSE